MRAFRSSAYRSSALQTARQAYIRRLARTASALTSRLFQTLLEFGAEVGATFFASLDFSVNPTAD